MSVTTGITPERIERALDRLAGFMVELGEEGAAYLSIYQRLETELENYRAADNKMAAVRARAKQSKSHSKKHKVVMEQLTITEMTDCHLEWQSQGVRRSVLPEGHTNIFIGVWQGKQLLSLCYDHADALTYAEQRAVQDDATIVDLVTGEMRLARADEWIPCPSHG